MMNLYDFAIQMSSDGEKFFHALAKQVKKPGLRTILVMLANDQAIHRRGFEKRKQKEGASLSDARSLTGVLNPFAQRLKRLGRGENLEQISASMPMVAEGVRTAKSARQLAERLGTDLPITREVYAMLYEAKSAKQAVRDLMARDAKPEFD